MWKHQYALLAMLSFMGGSFWLLEQAPAGPWSFAAAAGALLPYGACTVGLLALEGVFGELGIEVRDRLVGENNLRFLHEGAGDGGGQIHGRALTGSRC
mgnify:CR=1 FL=1